RACWRPRRERVLRLCARAVQPCRINRSGTNATPRPRERALASPTQQPISAVTATIFKGPLARAARFDQHEDDRLDVVDRRRELPLLRRSLAGGFPDLC